MKIKALTIKNTLMILGCFVFAHNVVAQENSVVITEIMYSPEGADKNHEWVEIFNASSGSIDLSEWKFFEAKTNHKLLLAQGESILNPKKYSIIADNAETFLSDYPQCTSSVFDSVFSLKNSGEVIAIKNSLSEIVNEVSYLSDWGGNGNGYSLEKEDAVWRESYLDGGTPCEENSTQPELGEYSNEMRINEVFPNPAESPERKYEFIELYNYGDKNIDLSGWYIKDKARKGELSGKVKPGEYIVFYGTVALNNSNENVWLFGPDDSEIDHVAYGKSHESYSYSFTGGNWEWTEYLTPEKKNEFAEEKKYSNKIYINEILPNPSGEEKKEEYIEIYNPTKIPIDLDDWVLKDSSKSGKYVFPEGVALGGNSYFVIKRKEFKFALNNSGGETVYLLDPNKEVVFTVVYSKASKGISYNYNGSSWRWSKFQTPGQENKFNKLPKIEVKIDGKAYKNVYVNFEVKVNDSDKDEIKVTWDFGDGKKSYKKKTRHKYKETGEYDARVKIFDGSEEVVERFKVEVKNYPKPKTRIVRILPNPKGKDSGNEWIELENKSKKEVNLKNWSIATGRNSKKLINHPVNEDFRIPSGKTRKITREFSKFTLNNKKSRIELRYPNGKVAHRAKYKREDSIEEDEVYGKIKNEGWKWTKNVVSDVIAQNVQDDENNVEVFEITKKAEEFPKEFFGKQSVEDDKNSTTLTNYNSSNKLSSMMLKNEPRVLGISIVKSNNRYFFNEYKYAKKEHYVAGLAKRILELFNSFINRIILKLNRL